MEVPLVDTRRALMWAWTSSILARMLVDHRSDGFRSRGSVQRIHLRAKALLERAGEFPAGSKERYLVQQALDRYLADAVAAYHALPEDWRNDPIAPDGRTGLQVLLSELELIERKLDEIATQLDRARADQFMMEEQFLRDQLADPLE